MASCLQTGYIDCFDTITFVSKEVTIPDKYILKKLINYLRHKGILLSTDGPYNNVIKIKPPMIFNKDNVDFVCREIKDFLINENKK